MEQQGAAVPEMSLSEADNCADPRVPNGRSRSGLIVCPLCYHPEQSTFWSILVGTTLPALLLTPFTIISFSISNNHNCVQGL